ncbi:unnamed protein product [Cladocopium goreaui]|uniref:Protein xylosyltransferase n=1 Tax=Cladocopium goreaui TaxID=2562237 RepID=A0A9P1BHC4_9DINO|nr:unnamed protein product [Cladocopium goreaui]
MALQTCVCSEPGLRLDRFRKELRLLSSEHSGPRGHTLARNCEIGWNDGSLFRLRQALSNASGSPACALGRIAELVLCSQQRLRHRDYVGVLRNLETANALAPLASTCMERLVKENKAELASGLSQEELYDNFRNAVRVLGPLTMRDEEEEGEQKDFFQQPIPQEEWLQRVAERMDEEKVEKLRWRSRTHPESNVFFGVPPLRGAGAPKEPRDSATEDEVCGLQSKAPRRATAFSGPSRARQLSASGCVWLLENACIEDRKIILFGRESEAESLPRKLLACGEFGSFEFNAVELRHPAARHLYPRNSSEVDTLVIAGALASGTSLHNPFHLMHSTIPLVWQLHHPDYGLCIPRSELDIRLAFHSAFHARRQVHFWKAFSRHSNDMAQISDAEKPQRLVIPAQWRFWWGPLAEMPPLPLGADATAKCYPRVIFGRELLRTGLGGVVTPRVVTFYHRYLNAVFAQSREREGPATGRAFDAELKMYGAMGVNPPQRQDAASLSQIAPGGPMDLDYFTADGSKYLTQPPALLPLDKEEVVQVDDEAEVKWAQSTTKKALRNVNVLWVQRPKRASRWIANMEEILNWLQGFEHPRFSDLRVRVLVAHFERLHPAIQWHLARHADILVGVTGAAMAWGAFMHQNAVILDLFPPGSKFCNEGWGSNTVSHYGGLARLSGMQYTCMEHPAALHGSENPTSQQEALYLADREVKEKFGGFWHGQNVRLNMPKFQQVFLEAVAKVLPFLPPERTADH